LKPVRILLAESDAVIAVLLAVSLSESGHEICAIETTQAAVVSAAARHHPDLLVVDMHLRAGSGTVAVKTVLRAGYIPYLLMSGGLVRGAPIGTVMLQKPFDHTKLFVPMERASSSPALVALKGAGIVR